MQRRDSCKTAGQGYVGRYVICGLALAIVAGCGGANDSSSAAVQSVTDPAQTSASSASNTNSSATSGTPTAPAQSGQVSGSASISWSAPTANTDGSALANLAGYKIDYGTSADSLTQSVTISDPTATSYTLQGLASGTWYFTVSDFTSAGVVSAFSSVVSKTIH